MKKKSYWILGGLLAVGIIAVVVIFSMDWGNESSSVDKTKGLTYSKSFDELTGQYISSNDPAKHEIFFEIDGPKSAKGKFHTFDAQLDINGSLESASLKVTIDVGSISTNNSTRDSHLRSEDFFHVDEHPKIVFNSERFEQGEGDHEYVAIGKLKFLGKEHDFHFPFTYRGIAETESGKELVSVEGALNFKPEAYGMPDNEGVGEVAKVSFYADLIKGGPEESEATSSTEKENVQQESYDTNWDYEKDEYGRTFDQIEKEAGL